MLRTDSLLGGALAGLAMFGLLRFLFPATPVSPSEATRGAATAESTASGGGPHGTGAGPAALRSAEDDDAILSLTMRMARLEEQLESLAEARTELPSGRSTPEVALAEATSKADPEMGRDLVLSVLEQEREREATERREELRERELQRAEDRADRVAEELALSGAERDSLASIYSAEAERRLELIERIQDLGTEDRDLRSDLRDELRDVRDETAAEIELRLGVDTAAAIQDSDAASRRGGGGFGGGGFGRGRRGG